MLLLYTLRVHVDWHDKLVLHKAHNITTINEDLLTKIAHKLDSREVKANLKLVCTPAHANHIKLTSSLIYHHV